VPPKKLTIQFAVGGSGQPWCASFAYEMVDNACYYNHIDNSLAKSAAAYNLIMQSTDTMIDKTPAPGAIGCRWSSDQTPADCTTARQHEGKCWHAVVVIDVYDGGFMTLEGNASDSVKFRCYKNEQIESLGFYFNHTEQMDASLSAIEVDNPFSALSSEDMTAIGIECGKPKDGTLWHDEGSSDDTDYTIYYVLGGLAIAGLIAYFVFKK
jgi:hypothetical protein